MVNLKRIGAVTNISFNILNFLLKVNIGLKYVIYIGEILKEGGGVRGTVPLSCIINN